MRFVHKLSKQCDIVILKCLYCTDSSLILIYSMLCSLSVYRIGDCICNGIKLFLCKLTKAVDWLYCLKLCKCCLTLASSFIIFGICKSSLLVAACNYNLCTCKLKRCICVGKICCVKEDCMTCFSHCDSKLIHDTTVYAIEFVL